MKKLNLNEVEGPKDYKKLETGGYICRITAVEDVPEKEYLKLEYDIAEGEYKDHYIALYKDRGFWGGRFIRSYKEKALPFFKGFVTAVQESNRGFVWKDEENDLKGKLVGLVLAEEDYTANDGTVKTRLYVHEARGVEAIKKGNYSIPAKRTDTRNRGKAVEDYVNPDEADTDIPF